MGAALLMARLDVLFDLALFAGDLRGKAYA
jgi:hypothetical protein